MLPAPRWVRQSGSVKLLRALSARAVQQQREWMAWNVIRHGRGTKPPLTIEER
jgi:hypothetical protein